MDRTCSQHLGRISTQCETFILGTSKSLNLKKYAAAVTSTNCRISLDVCNAFSRIESNRQVRVANRPKVRCVRAEESTDEIANFGEVNDMNSIHLGSTLDDSVVKVAKAKLGSDDAPTKVARHQSFSSFSGQRGPGFEYQTATGRTPAHKPRTRGFKARAMVNPVNYAEARGQEDAEADVRRSILFRSSLLVDVDGQVRESTGQIPGVSSGSEASNADANLEGDSVSLRGRKGVRSDREQPKYLNSSHPDRSTSSSLKLPAVSGRSNERQGTRKAFDDFDRKWFCQGSVRTSEHIIVANLTGRDLNLALAKEANLAKLLTTLKAYEGQLNEVQLCTAFHRLAKIAGRLKESDQVRQVRMDPTVQKLAVAVEREIPRFGPQALANAAWAHSQLGHGSPQLLEAVSRAALRQLPCFLPLEVSILMIAFGKSRGPSAGFITALADARVNGQVAQYKPRQLKGILWAHARHELAPPGLLQEIANHIEDHIDDFEVSLLSNIAWSYAKLGYPAASLLDKLANHVATNASKLEPLDVSNLAWAYAKLGMNSPDLLTALANRTNATCRKFSPQSLSNTVWAFATLGHYDRSLMEVLAAESTAQMARFSCQSIANSAWAFAALRHYSAPLLAAIAQAARCKLAQSEGSLLASLAYAFAVFGYRDETFLEAMSDEVMARLPAGTLHRQSLVTLAWSLAVLSWHRPDVVPALRLKLATILDYSSQQLCQLYQVELALRLEAPQMGQVPGGWRAESSAGAFLESLWLTGYLREQAKACWDRENDVEKSQVSAFQKHLSRTLKRMGLGHVCEHTDGDYSIDIALMSASTAVKVAVEADGPTHFAANDWKRPLGPTLLKARLLRRLGWHVVQIPYFEWMEVSTPARQEEYLRARIGPLQLAALQIVTPGSREPFALDCDGMESVRASASVGGSSTGAEPVGGDIGAREVPGVCLSVDASFSEESLVQTSCQNSGKEDGEPFSILGKGLASGEGGEALEGGDELQGIGHERTEAEELKGEDGGEEKEKASLEEIAVRAERLKAFQARKMGGGAKLKMLKDVATRRSFSKDR